MSNQFDISPDRRALIEEKLKRKLFLRNEFLKQKSDPFQHAMGGGSVFDSAFMRYNAMQGSYYNHFKPTGKNAFLGFVSMVVPMLGFMYLLKSSRDKTEASYRRGEVAYRDRNFRFQ